MTSAVLTSAVPTSALSMRDAAVSLGGRVIFDQVSFALPRGETMAILGPNGRGKTTLLKAILGAQKLRSGQRQAPRRIGYVPQSQHGSENHSCLDLVLMARAAQLGMFSLPSKTDRKLAMQAMERVGAAGFAERLYGTLSGGERQIVLLARALATGSDVLILDEPAAALDLANQDLLLGVLYQLRQERSHSIIFTTHHPQHALYLADKALLMHADAPVVFGAADEVLTEAQLTRLYNITLRRLAVQVDGVQQHTVCPIFGLRELQQWADAPKPPIKG